MVVGEIVVLNASGRPSFQALRRRGEPKHTVVYYAFDVLHVDGRDLSRSRRRRAQLPELVREKVLRISEGRC